MYRLSTLTEVTLSSSRQNTIQNVTFYMCRLNDKLIKVQQVIGLIHVKVKISNKYILSRNAVIKNKNVPNPVSKSLAVSLLPADGGG